MPTGLRADFRALVVDDEPDVAAVAGHLRGERDRRGGKGRPVRRGSGCP
jgi:hypothetical protein